MNVVFVPNIFKVIRTIITKLLEINVLTIVHFRWSMIIGVRRTCFISMSNSKLDN